MQASVVLGVTFGVALFLWEWLVRHGTVDGAAIGSIGGAVFSPVLVRLDPKERARRSRERGLAETLPVLERSE